MPKSLMAALEKLEVAVQGPVWNPIISAAVGQIVRLNEFCENKDFLSDLMPLVLLRRH